jgi:hypothetical protein
MMFDECPAAAQRRAHAIPPLPGKAGALLKKPCNFKDAAAHS